MPKEKIDKFEGEYYFLSNFSEHGFTYPKDHNYYKTNEHFFQAMKVKDQRERQRIIDAKTPSEAKKIGRKVNLRNDWEDIKVNVMKKGLLMKFNSNPAIRRKLLSTGDAELIEGNNWGDTFWGKVNGEGKNMLGKCLMELRQYYREEGIE